MTENFAEWYYTNYFLKSTFYDNCQQQIKELEDKIEIMEKEMNEKEEGYFDQEDAIDYCNIIWQMEQQATDLKEKYILRSYRSQEDKVEKICSILDNYKPLSNIDSYKWELQNFDLRYLLDCKFIATEIEEEEGYYYHESYALQTCISLYEFEGMYILLDFTKPGCYRDTDLLTYHMLNSSCTIYKKEDFKNLYFLEKVKKFSNILTFFKNKYPEDEYKIRLNKYIDYTYAKWEKTERKADKKRLKEEKKKKEKLENQISN